MWKGSWDHVRTLVVYNVGIAITAFLWCLIFQSGSIVGASLGVYTVLGVFVVLSKVDTDWSRQRLGLAERNYMITYVGIGCLLGIGTIAVHGIAFIVGVIFGWFYWIGKRKD